MRTKCVRAAFAFFLIAAMSGATASAKTSAKAPSTTDLAFSAYRSLTGSTQGNDTLQTPSDSVGGMVELSHIQSPLVGYEVTYAFNPANQSYAPLPGDCGYLCSNKPVNLQASSNQIGLDWIFSHNMGRLTPFAVGGLGFFITAPSLNVGDINTVVRPMFVYGGGLDWGFLPHAGLRIQYRSDLYKAPNLDDRYNATGGYTQTGEPMVGVYFGL